MPTYEYRCPSCGHLQEEKQPIKGRGDAPDCEGCGEETELEISLPRPGRVVGDENRPWHR